MGVLATLAVVGFFAAGVPWWQIPIENAEMAQGCRAHKRSKCRLAFRPKTQSTQSLFGNEWLGRLAAHQVLSTPALRTERGRVTGFPERRSPLPRQLGFVCLDVDDRVQAIFEKREFHAEIPQGFRQASDLTAAIGWGLLGLGGGAVDRATDRPALVVDPVRAIQ